MDRAALWELVRDKAAASFGEQAVDETTSLSDLDSLGVVELAMDLEDAAGVELAEADVTGTVGDLLDLVVARTGKTEP
jgi:acyl carrier protein